MAILCISCQGSDVQAVIHENHQYFYCQSCSQLHPRAIDTQYGKDILLQSDTKARHVSAGAAIKRDNQYLLLKRRTFPFGYDFPGGHIEYNENPHQALEREIQEETGLKIKSAELIYCGEIDNNSCRYGVDIHIQYFYECECGEETPFLNSESEEWEWIEKDKIGQLNLVPGARFLFEKVMTGHE